MRSESLEVSVEANLRSRLSALRGRSQNFESIHNHSAYALIERDKDPLSRNLGTQG